MADEEPDEVEGLEFETSGEAANALDLLASFEEYRASLRGFVKGLMDDGFTREQAHQLVTRVMTSDPDTDEDEEEQK